MLIQGYAPGLAAVSLQFLTDLMMLREQKYTDFNLADLAHYEIQDIISKNKKRGLTPVYDKEAAVKYMTWDDDQWISYDDADTFKDKVEWADSIGFTGSLIWASDLGEF